MSRPAAYTPPAFSILKRLGQLADGFDVDWSPTPLFNPEPITPQSPQNGKGYAVVRTDGENACSEPVGSVAGIVGDLP